MLTVCYINRQPGRGYHYFETNACDESAQAIIRVHILLLIQTEQNNVRFTSPAIDTFHSIDVQQWYIYVMTMI